MPRRAKEIIQVAMSDPRFRLLSFAEIGFWVHLMHLMLESPTPGRISFLGSVSASVARLVSVAEPVTETEAETQLGTYARLGLIEIDTVENAIWLVGAREASRRAEAARINGQAGGRRRKGETLEEMRARRQGNLILPLPGGRAETQETQAKPNAESSRATTTTTSLPIEVGGGSPAREVAELGSLEAALAATAKLDGSRPLAHQEQLPAWLGRGATPALLQRVVGRVASRPTYSPGKVTTWRFFNPAVEEALAQPTAASAAAAARPVAETAILPEPLNPSCSVDGLEDRWGAVHEVLRDRVGTAAYRCMRDLALVGMQDRYAVLTAPSRFIRDYVNTQFGTHLEAACKALLPDCRGYELAVSEAKPQAEERRRA